MIRKFSLIIFDNLCLICGNLFPSSQKSDCKQKTLFCLHIAFSFPLMLEAKITNLEPRLKIHDFPSLPICLIIKNLIFHHPEKATKKPNFPRLFAQKLPRFQIKSLRLFSKTPTKTKNPT